MIQPRTRTTNDEQRVAQYKAQKMLKLGEWNTRLRHLLQDVEASGYMEASIELKILAAQSSILDALDRTSGK